MCSKEIGLHIWKLITIFLGSTINNWVWGGGLYDHFMIIRFFTLISLDYQSQGLHCADIQVPVLPMLWATTLGYILEFKVSVFPNSTVVECLFLEESMHKTVVLNCLSRTPIYEVVCGLVWIPKWIPKDTCSTWIGLRIQFLISILCSTFTPRGGRGATIQLFNEHKILHFDNE